MTEEASPKQETFHAVADPRTAPDHPEFNAFVETIATLRKPDGCPWDLKQTHASIAKHMIEEAYEVVAAIEENDLDHMREELGDVLLEVVLQAQIAADAQEFTIDDVARDVNEKMIRRHPHVFGAKAACHAAGLSVDEVTSADDVTTLWDVIKQHERAQRIAQRAAKRQARGLDPDQPEGLLAGVSLSQPALMQAMELSRKTAAVGFEWETSEQVWDKVREEIDEFKAEPPHTEEALEEFGDVLFALVNVARKEGIEPEIALRKSCAKFKRRWEAMEAECYRHNKKIEDCGQPALEALWQQAKETDTKAS